MFLWFHSCGRRRDDSWPLWKLIQSAQRSSAVTQGYGGPLYLHQKLEGASCYFRKGEDYKLTRKDSKKKNVTSLVPTLQNRTKVEIY